MTDKRFEIKPITYFVGGKEWLGVGIYDTQGDLTKALLDSEICALLENQHERIQALEAIETRLKQAIDGLDRTITNQEEKAETTGLGELLYEMAEENRVYRDALQKILEGK